MFTIGEFSRMGGVTAKTLRHYDAIGLFAPAWVDPDCGYRHYSPAQLPELRRIVALRDLGLPLAEVATHVREGADLRSVLGRRRAELLAERDALERRLAAVEIQVEMAEDGSGHPDVVVRRLDAELVAGLRCVVGPGGDVGEMFFELEAYVRDQNRRARPPPATLVHAELEDGSRDVETVVPLIGPTPAAGGITSRTLASVRAATVIHRGDYHGLTAARRSLERWVGAAKLTPGGRPADRLPAVGRRAGATHSPALPGRPSDRLRHRDPTARRRRPPAIAARAYLRSRSSIRREAMVSPTSPIVARKPT